MRTEPVQLAGGAYTDESKPFSIQDTLNMRPQRTEAGGTRSPDKLQTLPGLRPYVEAGEDPVRATHNAEGRLLAVVGRTLYRISNTGVAIPIGTIPGSGRVMMDHNQISLGNEVMAVNGSAGYLWNTVTDAFERITDPGFPGASVVKFIDGYFVVIEPQGRFAQSSSPAQGLEWNTLDRFTSEVSPDRLMAAGVRGSEILLLSASSGEFFQATPNVQQPFRTKRIDFKVGAPGPYVVAEGDNNIWWLGSDGIFYCLNGYSQARISTRPIEIAIKGLDWSKVFAYRWDTVIYWTFPDGMTWGYDYAEREWHRRESYGLDRWRVNSMTFWNRRWIAGDFQSGKLWDCNLQDRYFLEGDTPYVCRRTLGVSHDNQNPVRAPRLELVMDTGQPETVAIAFPVQPEAPTITGAAQDGQAELAYSGYTYSISGGEAPLTVTVRDGSLPPGLEVSSAGVLSGTPTLAGTYAFTLRVTGANGLWDEIEDSVSILPAGAWLALLHFDGDFVDEVGNTWSSGTGDTSPVKFGSGSARIASAIGLSLCTRDFASDIGTGDWTIEGWIYRDSSFVGVVYDCLVGHWYTADTRSFQFNVYRTANGDIPFLQLSSDGVAITTIAGVNPVPYDEWVHLRTTRKSGVVRIFVNGIMDGSGAFAGALHSNTGEVPGENWVIGGYDAVPAQNSMNGNVDEFAMLTYCLSESDFTPPTAPYVYP